jgi:cyclopropane fatty-acyl-phospholipid synthase-like methyltransferase
MTSPPLSTDLFFEELPFYETVGSRVRAFFKKKIQTLNISHNPHIMDIGCGNGRWTIDLFPKAEVVYGFDVNQERLDMASKNFESIPIQFKPTQLLLSTDKSSKQPRIDYDLIDKTIPTKEIDTALVFGLFELINKQEIVTILEKLRNSVKEKGAVIFTFHPARRFSALYITTFIKSIFSLKFDFIKRIHTHVGYPVNSITLQEFQTLASNTGFECIEMGGLNPFPLILKMHENTFFKKIILKLPFFHTTSSFFSHWYCTQYYIGKPKRKDIS